MASEPNHRTVETNGIRMHLAEAGAGPLVLLCHGFPESWYSWRHQLLALAEAGFRAVAPDMRGYGRSDRPEAIDQYTLLHAASGRRHGGPARRSRRRNGRDCRPRLGRACRVAFGTPPPGSLSGCNWPQRPLSAARPSSPDHDDAADRRRRLLSALFPDPGCRRGRARARCRSNDPHHPLFGLR